MFFDKEIIRLNLNKSSDTEVIKYLARELERNKIVKTDFLEHVLDRENKFPTGLKIAEGVGIALPHTDSNYVNSSQIAFATLVHPVKFRNMVDSKQNVDVNFVFMIAMSKPHEQAELLSKLMDLCQDKSATKRLQKAKNSRQVIDVLEKHKIN